MNEEFRYEIVPLDYGPGLPLRRLWQWKILNSDMQPIDEGTPLPIEDMVLELQAEYPGVKAMHE